MLKFLFGAHCSSFYGAENSFEILNKERSIRKKGIAYHNAKKIICGRMKRDSSHPACDSLGLPTLKHFLMMKSQKSIFFCKNVDFAFRTVVSRVIFFMIIAIS